MLYAAYDEWGMDGSFRNSSRWQTLLGLNECAYYFHFDYWALQRAGVEFRSGSFFTQPSPSSHQSVRHRHTWSDNNLRTRRMTSFQEFKSLSQAAASTQQTRASGSSAAATAAPSATRWILDWDLLRDSELRDTVGSYSADEVKTLLAATEMSFGI
jgi:hypothetical protein